MYLCRWLNLGTLISVINSNSREIFCFFILYDFMDTETKAIIKIIEKNHVHFDKSWLIRYLKYESNRRHLNDFDSIQDKVTLLNTIMYYEYYDGLETDVDFAHFNNQLDDRIALENSYKWVETYNTIMITYGLSGDNLLEHSCFTQTCVEDSIREMYKNKNDIVQRFKQFKRELYRRKIYDINNSGNGEDNDEFSCITLDSDHISKKCSKEYLDTYYSYMGKDRYSSIWNYLVPEEIRAIITDASSDYMNGNLYTEINEVFRSEDDLTSQIGRNYINGFLKVCRLMVFPASLSEDIVVYRRDGFMDSSETVKTKGFYSCSISFDRVRGWGNQRRIMKIRIPAGQKFLTIGSFMNRNYEIILMPSTLFKRVECIEYPNDSGKNLFCDYVVESTYTMDKAVRNALMMYNTHDKRSMVRDVLFDVLAQ